MEDILAGKKILLGVTGGIAAYKSCELLRRLQDCGAQVRVAMTPNATEFVGPLTFAALSGSPVFLHGQSANSAFQHIEFPRWADLIVVAPASAQSLARLAQGMADEPVSQCVLASLVPKVIVPAMNYAMFQSPAVQRNIRTLVQDGFHIVEPGSGRLACGEEGQGRYPEISQIIDAIRNALKPAAPTRTVLITLGRTEEPIDPVRIITNRSSGKTGVALAKEFQQRGFHVILVAGPMDAQAPTGCELISVRTALEMHQAVLDRQAQCDALVFCAAVADYRPRSVSAEKIKDSRAQVSIELEPNPNILRDAVAAKKLVHQVIVGFALETANAIEHGVTKLQKSGADFLVLNTPVKIDSGFGKDSVEYCILEKNQIASNTPSLQHGEKSQLASDVVSKVLAAWSKA